MLQKKNLQRSKIQVFIPSIIFLFSFMTSWIKNHQDSLSNHFLLGSRWCIQLNFQTEKKWLAALYFRYRGETSLLWALESLDYIFHSRLNASKILGENTLLIGTSFLWQQNDGTIVSMVTPLESRIRSELKEKEL